MKNLIDLLPSSWDDINLETFQKLFVTPIEDSDDAITQIENGLRFISSFLDIPLEQLEELSMNDVQKLVNKIAFIYKLPKYGKKTRLKLKTLDEVTFNDYTFLLKKQEDGVKNMHLIIQQLSIEPLTMEEILNLPCVEVFNAFFLSVKSCKKLIQHSIKSTRKKLNQQMKEERTLMLQ